MTVMVACSSPKKEPVIYTRGLAVGDTLGMLLMDEHIDQQQKETEKHETNLLSDVKVFEPKDVISSDIKYEKSHRDDNALYIIILSLLIVLIFKDEKKNDNIENKRKSND
jgi:hypothetical protein